MTRSAGGPRTQRGQAIVLIALMLTILIGMAAIAIDGARAYAMRRDLQSAVDAAALAAGDKLQQSSSYPSAEQAATNVFSTNLRLYSSPSCSGYGSPGASPFAVTCTYSDGTTLTQIVSGLGPQGSQFTISATRSLVLQFARVLTSGLSPTLAASAGGGVNNLVYTPAVAALDPDGCGGVGGAALTINGSGTLNVNGDVVSNGAISVLNATMRVAGDIYSRCQGSVAGASNACYSTGASTPCGYPDIAGATHSGFRLADPNFPPPNVTGGSQGLPGANVVIQPGIYSGFAALNGRHCWFLSGGIYELLGGATNSGDFVSNELKPPDEPNAYNNTHLATQFWNTNGVNCAGAFQVTKVSGPRDIQTGTWSFVITSLRTDTYNGFSYTRESAPSMCKSVNLSNHFDNVQLQFSNVPGATSYNIYAAPPGNGCGGQFGLAANLPVSGPVLNTNTNPCPVFTGNGCTLGNESIVLSSQLAPPFGPSATAAPGTTGAYPPDGETAPLSSGLPNQNPARGPGSRGDRANENNCETVVPTYATCPAPISPGAVELYVPAGGCMTTSNGGDTYLFSGYHYNWVSVYEPAANACAVGLGAASNSAYIGLVYAPGAAVAISSPYAFETVGTGGVIADTVAFSGTMPSIAYNAAYAPVPPASRLSN